MAKSKAEYWLTDDGLTLLKGWARDGLTDEQIAHNMEISVATLYNYKNKYLDIFEALKKEKEIVDYEVENSLLKRALGYTKTLKKQKVTKDGCVVDIKEEIHIPPDTTAMIYWLNNRKPKEWRNKQEIKTMTANRVQIINDLPSDENESK
nr:MAG TPA: terminase small subunit [Caudoviricetes sp.]